MSKKTSFKARLEKLLSRKIKINQGKIDFDSLLTGNSTFLDLVLVAQIKKAAGGDTSSAGFLRDTSGNKLKDKAENDETTAKNPFELL